MQRFDKLIFDIGMHTGEDTRYYLAEGYKVVAIEANPLLVEQNKKKFKAEIETGQLVLLNVGIASEGGVLPFYRNHRLSEWSSFDKATGTRNNTAYDVINVNCVTTRSLFEKYGIPYYMKVDIEGFDHFPLLDISAYSSKPKYVSCEAVQLDWLKILHNKGYTRFKMIHQGNGYNEINLDLERKWYFPKYQVIKNGLKIRLQKLLPFKHLYGSSGPFGEQTKGEWKTYEEVKNLYLAFYQFDKKCPVNPVSWFDFHASY